MTGPQISTSLRTILIRSDEQIAAYRRELHEEEAFNVHVRAVLAVVENDASKADRPSTGRMSMAGIFKRLEVYTYCIKALEDAGSELSTRQLAEACMRARGLDQANRVQRGTMMQLVITTLTNHKDKNEIFSPRMDGKLRIWRLRGRS